MSGPARFDREPAASISAGRGREDFAADEERLYSR
jgi:hypothetical protein